MTREEAIKIFNTVLLFGKCDCPKEEIEECLKMAIQALEQESYLVNMKDLPDDKLKKLEEVMKKVTVQVIPKEPCEDAISRQAAIDCLNANFTIDGKENMETVVDYINGAFKQIKALPSVTPKPKVGHWITEIKSDLRGDMWPTNPKCSECGGEPYFSKTIYSYNFCPYCGAKMVESQESEG